MTPPDTTEDIQPLVILAHAGLEAIGLQPLALLCEEIMGNCHPWADCSLSGRQSE